MAGLPCQDENGFCRSFYIYSFKEVSNKNLENIYKHLIKEGVKHQLRAETPIK